MSKKIKCAIKFVRALLTNFHIKLFDLKEDKAENFLGIAIMLIHRYSGHFEKLWLLGVGCTSRNHTQYKWRLEKYWERPTKRAIMAIIMHSDEASSIKS